MSYADWLGEDRRVRAYRMFTDAADHHIARTFARRGVYVVRSQRRAGITYSVNPARKTCTCPDFRRNAPITVEFLCKHLYLVAIVRRGGRLLRVRGRIDFGDGSYLESGGDDDTATGDGAMAGHFAVKALAPHHAFVVDIASGRPVCGHAHDEAKLRAWFTSGAMAKAASPCPHCIGDKMELLVVGAPSDPAPGGGRQGPAAPRPLSNAAADVLAMYIEWRKKGMPREFRDEDNELVTEEKLRGTDMLGDEGITLADLKRIWSEVGIAAREWSGTTGTTKEDLIDKLVELVMDPLARQPPKTAPRALRQRTLVTKDSLRESLAKDARNDLYRMVVYGHDRCNETILKDIGVTSLASYQEIMRWAAARSGREDIAKAHSFLVYHPTGAGKTASLWLMLGTLWNVRTGKAKEKVFHKKFLFVTKHALVQKMDPAKDVWAFYEGAGPGARDAVRRAPSPKASTEHFEQWMHFFPTPERGIDSVEPVDRMRLLSYDKLYNACRANSPIGRSMYGVELDLEGKGVGTLRTKVMGTGDTYPEKGGKPIDDGDDATFLAELRKTRVLRSTQPEWIVRTIDKDISRMNAEMTFLRKRKFTGDPERERKEQERDANVARLVAEIAAKRADRKKSVAAFATLVKSSERLLETKLADRYGAGRNWEELGYAAGPKPAKTESQRWKKDDAGYTKARKGKSRDVDVETPALEKSISTALDAIGGRDALAPIDPLRDAVIAIDEADVLFSAGGEIGKRAEVIEQAIYHSYDVSFTHAVRVILATATPAHTGVDDTFRLLNLLIRDKTQRVSDVGSAGEDPKRVAVLKAGIAELADKRDAKSVAEIGEMERELDGMFATGPSVNDLAGSTGDFDSSYMWEYANIVSNAIAHLDLTADFDHFPHRVRETVSVDVAKEFAGEYDAFVDNKVGGASRKSKARGKDGGDTSPSTDDPDAPRPEPSKAAIALMAMTRDLRAFTNMLAPDEGAAFPDAFRLGHHKYDPVAFAKHVTDKPWAPETPREEDALPLYGRAPKVVALLRKIHEIDSQYYNNIEDLRKAHADADAAMAVARDADAAQATERVAQARASLDAAEKMPPPKHAIICEAPREYGAPLVAAALDVAGFAWRPFRRTYRPAAREGRKDVATIDFTQVRETSAGEAGEWLPDDARAVRPGDDDSNFFVLDPRLLDFSTETREDGFVRQARGETYRVNTEYRFLAKTHLKKLLGEGDADDAAIGDELTAIARKKIYRPNGSAAFGTTLAELFVEDRSGDTALPSAAVLAQGFFGKIGVDPATATLADLHGMGVVRWSPWMQTSQRVEAAKRVVEKFNSLEDNDRAQLARIIVLSREFTTGTDLFQTEHIHLFDAVEPVADGEGGELLTRDRIQMEGRAWRRCGHSYLRSLTNAETVVNVYEYRLNAGTIVAQKALRKFIRGKHRPNRMVDTADRSAQEWRIDDVVQALRTDPADFYALSRIDSFMRRVAFDAEANQTWVYGAPVYTGYTLTDSATGARPLYRRSTGELVSVNDEPIEEIAHFGNSLLKLWREKRAMWDQYAGAWKGVADREQGAIEAEFATVLEKHVESLLRLDARTNPGPRMDPTEDRKSGEELPRDTAERLQEIRGWSARIDALMDALDEEMRNLLAGVGKGGKTVAKKGKDSAEYKARKLRYDDLDARKKPLDKLIVILERDLLEAGTASADAVGTGEGGGALMLWRERASFYRRTRTLLPLASDVKDAPMKQEVVGWYDVVKGATVSASEAAGFQLRKDRVRDLWFASHIDDRWDINVFEDVARAAKRMLFTQSKKVRDMTMARYIEIALGPTHYPDTMASTPKIQNVIRIAGWVNPATLRRDIGYFVDYLGMTIDKVIEEGIIRYGIVPGKSEMQRRIGIASLLANRERVNAETQASLWKRLILSAQNVFGRDFDVSMARLLATILTKWYGRVVSWKARSTARAGAPGSVGAMGEAPPEPDAIDALYAIADRAARFFANRAAPTRVFAIMRTVGAEFGVKYPMFIAEFLNAAMSADASVAAEGAADTAVAAITAVMERPEDDFTKGTRCTVYGRDDAKFDKLRNAGRDQGLPTAATHSAVRALSDANGSWVEAVRLLPDILLTGSRLHIKIRDDTTDARLEGGADADIFMDTDQLKGTSVTRELYFYNAEGERRSIAPADGVGWLVAIRDWLIGGAVCVTSGVKFMGIVEKKSTAATELTAATTAIVKRLAPGWRQESTSALPGDVAKRIFSDRFEEASCYDSKTVESYLTLHSRQLFGVPFGDLSGDEDGRDARAVLGAINAVGDHWARVANVARRASRVLYKLTNEAAMRWITDTAAPRRLKIATVNANDTPALATAIFNIFRGMRKDVNGAAALAAIRPGKSTDGMTVLKWALDGPFETQGGWDLINEWADNERQLSDLAAAAVDVEQFDVTKIGELKVRNIAIVKELKALGPLKMPRVIGMEPKGEVEYVGRLLGNMRKWDVATEEMKQIFADQNGGKGLGKAELEAFLDRRWQQKRDAGKKAAREVGKKVKDVDANDKDFVPDADDAAADMQDEMDEMERSGEDTARIADELAGLQAARVQVADAGLTGGSADQPMFVGGRVGGGGDDADGASIALLRAQPLRLASPVHLQGQLVPVHIATRLVWTAPTPTGRRLTLVSGRVVLPSGRVLDPWEEEGPIVADFF